MQDAVFVLANAMDTLLNRCSSLKDVDCASDNLLTGNNVVKVALQTTASGYTGPIRFLPNGKRTRDSMPKLFSASLLPITSNAN